MGGQSVVSCRSGVAPQEVEGVRTLNKGWDVRRRLGSGEEVGKPKVEGRKEMVTKPREDERRMERKKRKKGYLAERREEGKKRSAQGQGCQHHLQDIRFWVTEGTLINKTIIKTDEKRRHEAQYQAGIR